MSMENATSSERVAREISQIVLIGHIQVNSFLRRKSRYQLSEHHNREVYNIYLNMIMTNNIANPF